jgi:prolipoprotein diacylglyceryl transferase
VTREAVVDFRYVSGPPGDRVSAVPPEPVPWAAVTYLASIPSPSTAVWHLGPIPLRAYAICIVAGIVLACVITEARLRRRGIPPYTVLDLAVWAVPFGIVGARVYHVITDPELYFAAGRNWIDIFKIWNGGLGIWGGVAGGALGAWIACRLRGLPLSVVADALAPGLPVAQAVGRWGNYFNQELFGRPSTLPWAVSISPEHRLVGYEQYATYQPTFLYEFVWDLGVALFVWLLDRRFRFGRGRAFALYVMAYVVGRAWIEALRIDPANHLLGLRLNDWVSILVFVGALAYFVLVRGPQLNFTVSDDGRLTPIDPAAALDEPAPAAPADDTDEPAGGQPAEPDGGAAAPEPPGDPDTEDKPIANHHSDQH